MKAITTIGELKETGALKGLWASLVYFYSYMYKLEFDEYVYKPFKVKRILERATCYDIWYGLHRRRPCTFNNYAKFERFLKNEPIGILGNLDRHVFMVSANLKDDNCKKIRQLDALMDICGFDYINYKDESNERVKEVESRLNDLYSQMNL